MRLRSKPIGAILAGGEGLRIGGREGDRRAPGKPLICYPVEAMRQVLSRVTILAKAGTRLPPLSGVAVWIEPERPHHPLVGDRPGARAGRWASGAGVRLRPAVRHARADPPTRQGRPRQGPGRGRVRAGRDAAAARLLSAAGARTPRRRGPGGHRTPVGDDRRDRTGPARGRRARGAVRRRHARTTSCWRRRCSTSAEGRRCPTGHSPDRARRSFCGEGCAKRAKAGQVWSCSRPCQLVSIPTGTGHPTPQGGVNARRSVVRSIDRGRGRSSLSVARRSRSAGGAGRREGRRARLLEWPCVPSWRGSVPRPATHRRGQPGSPAGRAQQPALRW